MFNSIGFEITSAQPVLFTTPPSGQYAIVSIAVSNMSENSLSNLRVDLMDTSGNRMSTPIKKLPLDPDESTLIDTKMFVSNGNSLKFSTLTDTTVSLTVSYYTV